MSPLMRERARATNVEVTGDALIVTLEDGRTLHVSLEGFPRLQKATPAQRANLRLLGNGIGVHWPDVDEDISIEGLEASC